MTQGRGKQAQFLGSRAPHLHHSTPLEGSYIEEKLFGKVATGIAECDIYR